MELLTTGVVGLITYGLTALSKNALFTEYSAHRVLLVRLMTAVFAIVLALIAGEAVDATMVETAVSATIAFLSAVGLFHVPKKA